MVKSKRILSVILSIVMVLTIVPFGAFSTAVAVSDDVTTQAVDAGDGKLVIPTVTLSSTPTIRTADATNHMKIGNILVKATPSGIGELLTTDPAYARASEYYAGETPAAPTVVFTADKDISNPTITCENNSSIKFSAVQKSGNTYTWQIVSDTNNVTIAQNTLHFRVGYSFSYDDSLSGETVTKTYKAYCSSAVEKISQPGSFYAFRTRSATWTTHEREHSAFTVRIMGANTFGSYYTTTSDSSWDKGYPNFKDCGSQYTDSGFDKISGSSEGAAGYGGVHYAGNKDSGDGNRYHNTGVDQNRPVSTIYVDRGYAVGLDSYNARISVYPQNTRGSYKSYLRKVAVKAGEVGFDSNYSDENTARGQLGFEAVNSDVELVTCKNYSITMNGKTYGNDATTLENGNQQTAYTVIVGVGCYYSKSDRICNSHFAIDYRVVSYDKSELRGLVDEILKDNDPTTKFAADSEIGIYPNAEYYTSATDFNDYIAKLQAAQDIIADPDTNQKAIDAAYTALDTAVGKLKVKEADYSTVNAAIERAKNLNSENYTDVSWTALQAKINAATAGYSYFYQCAVYKMAQEINAAIEALQLAPADYEEVEQLIEVYETLNPDEYTPDSWSVLRGAVNDVEYGLTVDKQGIVDAYAQAIAAAFDGLKFALADYTAVNEQVARYNELKPNSHLYVELRWRAVETAYSAIQFDKTWKQQSTVDSYARTLKTALDNLQYNGANYTSVTAALSQYRSLEEEWYTPETWAVLASAVKAVKTGLDITHQDEVNAMATAITDAIAQLVEADGDYTAVDAIIDTFNDLDSSIYTTLSYSNVQNVISSVDYNLKAKDQEIIDGYKTAIEDAMSLLVELPADYTSVNSLVSQWNNLPNKDNYTDGSILNVQNVINGIDWTLTITKQSEVNAYADAIRSAIANLQLKTANYTEVNKAMALARDAQAKQNAFAASHSGYSFYTPASYAELEKAMNAVVMNYDISKQSKVDTMANNLNAAVIGLKNNTADYAKVNEALTKIPADIEDGNYVDDLAAAVIVAQESIIYGYTTDKQDQVDAMATELLNAINALAYKSADYSAVDALIAQWAAYPDKDKYTANSVKAVDDAVAAVVTGYDLFKQDEVDAMATAIQNAINNLKLDVADYSSVETAKASANAALANESLYTAETVKAVKDAIDAVEYGLKSGDQARVNAMAAAINTAVTNLQYKTLDLTAYNAALATIPADTTNYTDASVAAVTNAKSACESYIQLNNDIRNQSAFDNLVNSLSNAIAALAYKGADYSAVNAAKSSANALTKSNYIDFSAVDSAVAAVVEGLDITHQSEVNAMAKAITDAIAALELKAADYTAVEDAKNAVPADLSIYTAESVEALNAVINAVDYTLKIDKQSTVNAYAANITRAIAALVLNLADYTALDALVASIDEMNSANYKNWDDIYWNYIYEYVEVNIPEHRTYNVSEQASVDAMVSTLQGYVDMLELKGADYSAVNAKVNEVNAAIASGMYTDASVKEAQKVLDTIDYSLDILHQADVNAFVKVAENAMKKLVEKAADFSKIDELYNWFEGLDSSDYTNYDEIYWDYVYMYYNVDVEDARYIYTKISQQAEVDAMYDTLKGYCDMLESANSALFEAKEGSTTVIGELDGNKVVYGLKSGLTADELLKDYVNYENVTVEVSLSNSKRYVGTGSVIKVFEETAGGVKTLIDEYTVVLFGDINGDGFIDTFDVNYIYSVVGQVDEPLTGVYETAANVQHDTFIDIFDLNILFDVASGMNVIDQATGTIA